MREGVFHDGLSPSIDDFEIFVSWYGDAGTAAFIQNSQTTHQSLLGRGLVGGEDLWLKIGKVAEYRFVSVLSLLYVVFIEFGRSPSDAGSPDWD